MKRILGLTLVMACASVNSSGTQQAPQTFTGRISDSTCGASHEAKGGTLTERNCIFECLKSLAKWVLVTPQNEVIPIDNQDLPGLALYAGRPVRLTGELKGGAILGTRVEAYPPHLHIGHVMTNWGDTPGSVGLLIAAISDARVAGVHAKLAANNPDDLGSMKLHAAHVLNALDPSIEPTGPGSGYGVKKASEGALQHLELATKAEGATANVRTHAVPATTSLADAARWTAEAVAIARQIRSATIASEALPLARNLSVLATRLLDNALVPARAHVMSMMKGEGIENAPR